MIHEPPSASVPPDPYVLQHRGLVEIHQAITGALARVIATPPDNAAAIREGALGSIGFLLGHHEAESTILFPGLRRLGKLRSTDVAFLDARDREHEGLHHLCERGKRIATGSTSSAGASEIVTLIKDIAPAFAAHIAEEEKGLAPENLRAMISVAGLAEIGRELEALRARYAASGPPR